MGVLKSSSLTINLKNVRTFFRKRKGVVQPPTPFATYVPKFVKPPAYQRPPNRQLPSVSSLDWIQLELLELSASTDKMSRNCAVTKHYSYYPTQQKFRPPESAVVAAEEDAQCACMPPPPPRWKTLHTGMRRGPKVHLTKYFCVFRYFVTQTSPFS